MRVASLVDGDRIAVLGVRGEIDVLDRRRTARVEQEAGGHRHVDERAHALALGERPLADDGKRPAAGGADTRGEISEQWRAVERALGHAWRPERLRARRVFLAFPVERHAPVRPRRARPAEPAEHAPLIAQLERLHAILNERHFGGRLGTIPVRLSTRMERRLGEFEATHDGRAVASTLSRRHLDRDGWSAATETLLHEMVHQWQCENGMPLDHGRAFRQKARAVGIPPAATVRADTLSASSRPGTIA